VAGEAPNSPFNAQIKIRYKASDLSVVVNTINRYTSQVRFESPVRDITPGQAAVLYNGEVCLGGGIISNMSYT
jgi:tRNA-specific 2-thiouridylase